MQKDIEKEVVDVLTNTEAIGFEHLQAEEISPLNQAVVEKEIPGVNTPKDWNVWKPEKRATTMENEAENFEGQNKATGKAAVEDDGHLDAPEQEIGEGTPQGDSAQQQNGSGEQSQQQEEFELPTATAKQAADTLLGMTSNILAVGGSFFVKIKKHKEFYEFEEINELIDTQNTKNVDRIKLDKEDKALLKPPLVQVLKKKAKNLTPEQQLMGAALSIVLRKVQSVMEVRAENELLVERILDIIREEKGVQDQQNYTAQEPLEQSHSTLQGEVVEEEETATVCNETSQSEELNVEEYDDDLSITDNIIEIADEEDNTMGYGDKS